MTDTYTEAINILPTVLFNIVNKYYYGDNMYPFLEQIRNHNIYDLNIAEPTLDDFDNYDWKKNHHLQMKYNKLSHRYNDFKTLTDLQKEILHIDTRSYNLQLYEFCLYGNNLLDLTFIKCDMGNSLNWSHIENDGHNIIELI